MDVSAQKPETEESATPRSYDIKENHGHVPVLVERVTELLAPALERDSSPIVIDGTLGAGGHSEHLLESFPHCVVIGVDRDGASLTAATRRLARFGERFVPLHSRFDAYRQTLAQSAPEMASRVHSEGVAAALFDLGVSSMQLDEAERGFAYRMDAPLDMRMDPGQRLTAADILNTYTHSDLARILRTYGDERFAGKIASAVVRERVQRPFDTSERLVQLLYEVIPAAARRTGGHPAKRTFQALRVEVNAELDALRAVIPQIAEDLHVGGRMVFMSYQSLEDKIVKQALAELSTSSSPPGLPVDLPGTAPRFELLTRGAEKASDREIDVNSRAASVRVRAAEKIRDERS